MSVEEVVDELRRELEPRGWKLQVSTEDSEYDTVILEHPLTTPFEFSFNSNEPTGATVSRLLQRTEFGAIADAPDALPHVQLLGKLRSVAPVWGWDDRALTGIARVLRSEGLLTEAEADWLEAAGPAWAD